MSRSAMGLLEAAMTVQPRVRKRRRRPHPMPAPATIALAVGVNAVLGVVGYVPYILTVLLVQVVLMLMGRLDLGWQAAPGPPMLAPIVAFVWFIYPQIVYTSNRWILARSAIPRRQCLAIAAVALVASCMATGAATFGLYLG